jgi:hypothetical protein
LDARSGHEQQLRIAPKEWSAAPTTEEPPRDVACTPSRKKKSAIGSGSAYPPLTASEDRVDRLVEQAWEQVRPTLSPEAVAAPGAARRADRSPASSAMDESPLPQELAPGERIFRVSVPKPYPGVQYRRSKRLDDRHQRYAANGTCVVGKLEGDWLVLGQDLFLPINVSDAPILQAVPTTIQDRKPASQAVDWWWSCCQVSRTHSGEIDMGQYRERDANQNGSRKR